MKHTSTNFRQLIDRLSGNGWLHSLLFPLVLLWDELFLRLLTGTPLWRNLFFPVIFALAAGLLLSAVTALFGGKIRRWISLILLAGFSLFFTVECILKNTFQLYISLPGIISGAGNVAANYGSNVLSAITGGIGLILLFFLPVILYLISWRLPLSMAVRRPQRAVILLVCSLILSSVGILAANRNSSVKNIYASDFTFDMAAETFGLLTGTRLDLEYDLFGNPAADTLVAETSSDEEEDTAAEVRDLNLDEQEEEEPEVEIVLDYGYNEMDIDFSALAAETDNETVKGMHEYVASLEPSNKNEYTGLFEGKNLIMITAESFAMQVINEELTPTLYRLANKGINFTNFYQPAWEGGSTTTGEFAFLLSLVPRNEDDSLYDTAGNNLYFTMGNQLQRQGYYSLAFHNGTYTYYHRDQTHYNLGYDDFLAWGHELDDYVTRWSGDSATVEATMPLYIDEQPFSVYYMSYSGHGTYDADDPKTKQNLERVKEVLGDEYEDKTLYYFCYQLDFEYALEYMVNELEEKGIADDTVIVICPDHYPYALDKSSTFGNTEDYLKDLYKDDSYNQFVRDRNAGIIWSGCIEDMGLEVDAPSMSLDLLPTLSNLFGLEYDSRLLVGRDVFSDTMPLVFWTGGSFVTEKGRYDASTGEFEPFEGETVDDEYIDQIKTMVSNKVSFSKQVVQTDYYRILFGEDTITDSAQVRDN